ncbi:hypothetical protein [Thermodesulfovibrio hydrogeniphilus]
MRSSKIQKDFYDSGIEMNDLQKAMKYKESDEFRKKFINQIQGLNSFLNEVLKISF